jgi:hypothetical protein
MPREKYLSSWKIFRAISNENEVTANHILSLKSWEDINSILDLGCGDGLITKSLVLNSEPKVNEVILIDPDKEMLDEAYLHIREINVVPDIKKELSTFENCFKNYIAQADIAIAVHLVYLISAESFLYLLNELPIGKKLIIVLDDESSVFTQLWNRTAKKYIERSNFVRKTLNSLGDKYLLNKTIITSKLINPYKKSDDIKNALLSLMSYSDYSSMNLEYQTYVKDCINKNISSDYVECKSACYELIKQ